MKKILLIHSIITPAITLLFNKMNDKFINQGYIFKVIFTSENEGNRKWNIQQEINNFNFGYDILNGKQIHSKSTKDHHYFHLNFDIYKVLNKEKPNVLIHAGWAGLSAFISCLWSKNNNCKYILWSGSTNYEKSWRRVLTKPLVKLLVNNSNSFLSYGTRASEYLESLGADKYKIYKLYNTIDVDFFINSFLELKNKKEFLKNKYYIKTKKILLYVGRLEKGKGIYNVVDGFIEYQKKDTDISLLIVGGGNEENNIKENIKNKGYKNIIFTGYIQKNHISELFVISDILTLPSYHEIWGLVINEAMCFGLPLLTTYTVGASVDLVQEGKNGYIMKENNKEEFKKGLDFIIGNNLINNNNSLEIIKEFSFDKILNNLKI